MGNSSSAAIEDAPKKVSSNPTLCPENQDDATKRCPEAVTQNGPTQCPSTPNYPTTSTQDCPTTSTPQTPQGGVCGQAFTDAQLCIDNTAYSPNYGAIVASAPCRTPSPQLALPYYPQISTSRRSLQSSPSPIQECNSPTYQAPINLCSPAAQSPERTLQSSPTPAQEIDNSTYAGAVDFFLPAAESSRVSPLLTSTQIERLSFTRLPGNSFPPSDNMQDSFFYGQEALSEEEFRSTTECNTLDRAQFGEEIELADSFEAIQNSPLDLDPNVDIQLPFGPATRFASSSGLSPDAFRAMYQTSTPILDPDLIGQRIALAEYKRKFDEPVYRSPSRRVRQSFPPNASPRSTFSRTSLPTSSYGQHNDAFEGFQDWQDTTLRGNNQTLTPSGTGQCELNKLSPEKFNAIFQPQRLETTQRGARRSTDALPAASTPRYARRSSSAGGSPCRPRTTATPRRLFGSPEAAETAPRSAPPLYTTPAASATDRRTPPLYRSQMRTSPSASQRTPPPPYQTAYQSVLRTPPPPYQTAYENALSTSASSTPFRTAHESAFPSVEMTGEERQMMRCYRGQ